MAKYFSGRKLRYENDIVITVLVKSLEENFLHAVTFLHALQRDAEFGRKVTRQAAANLICSSGHWLIRDANEDNEV